MKKLWLDEFFSEQSSFENVSQASSAGIDSGTKPSQTTYQYGLFSLRGRFSWTFSRFIPTWKPFMVAIAACADIGLSKLTKPKKQKAVF